MFLDEGGGLSIRRNIRYRPSIRLKIIHSKQLRSAALFCETANRGFEESPISTIATLPLPNWMGAACSQKPHYNNDTG
jgi:hypothetical protein